MSNAPEPRRTVQPARIVWTDGLPTAPDFADVYHARAGAAAQTHAVFLAGNGLPERWAGRADFTIFENGFGLGHNLLETWRCWLADPQRGARLHLVALDAHPPSLCDLRRAHRGRPTEPLARALVAQWPLPVPGVHALAFDGGRVRLTLAWGDVRTALRELVFGADAFYLDGFAPDRNPAMWDADVLRALARRARPGATAATWSVARGVRDGLQAAGFRVERAPGHEPKRERLQARFAPRHAVAPLLPELRGARHAVVIGAGLAGACVARALAERGWQVAVLDAAPAPACGASGNPAGIFHPTLHGDDGRYAQLYRAGALHTQRLLRGLDGHAVPMQLRGLARTEARLTLGQMQALIAQQGWPQRLVRALSPQQASARLGVALDRPAWWYGTGGWVDPRAWVRERLAHPSITLHGGAHVQRLERCAGRGAPPAHAAGAAADPAAACEPDRARVHDANRWRCHAAGGQVLAEAPHVFLCVAEGLDALLRASGLPLAPIERLAIERGQITLGRAAAAGPTAPKRPLAGDGYALALPDGRVLCGATRTADASVDTRAADERANLERLERLTGIALDPHTCSSRAARRVQMPDRLPLAGAWPAAQATGRSDQARLWPRVSGLHVLSALGARGLTLAPLLAECVAARASGTPLALPQRLLDAVDPARVLVAAAKAGR